MRPVCLRAGPAARHAANGRAHGSEVGPAEPTGVGVMVMSENRTMPIATIDERGMPARIPATMPEHLRHRVQVAGDSLFLHHDRDEDKWCG